VVGRRPQPGGRPSAPGRLALVQAFINSHYDLEYEHGAELLRSPAALVTWLHGAGLITQSAAAEVEAEAGARPEAGAHDLQRALALREGLQTLVRDGLASGALEHAARGAAVEVRATPAGELHFVAAPSTGVAGALGVLLAIAATAMVDGSWSRLKICPAEDCGWAFFDGSRNRSGRWCSMAVCGGRAKARTHYHRRTREV
jgi:predicted RNA-binding Zn ribbon-like protein